MAIGRTNIQIGRKLGDLLLDASSLKTVVAAAVPQGQSNYGVFTNMDLSHRYWLFNYIAYNTSEGIYQSRSGILDIKSSKMKLIHCDGLSATTSVNNDFIVTIDDVAGTITIGGSTRNRGVFSLAKIEGLD